jgi:hypothetical protein
VEAEAEEGSVSEATTVGEISTTVKFCGAQTREGGSCRQVVGLDSESGRCPFHDPDRTPPRGARAGARTDDSGESPPGYVPAPPSPETLDDVTRWHSWITGALARGQIDKATATGLAYNLQQHRAELVSRDLEREVEELRATVKELKQRRAA